MSNMESRPIEADEGSSRATVDARVFRCIACQGEFEVHRKEHRSYIVTPADRYLYCPWCGTQSARIFPVEEGR